jgi:hypothetical protein
MKVCRQLGFRTERDVNMVQERLWSLPTMAFSDVRRNGRSAPFHLRHDAETFPRWQQVGETVAVDDQFDSLTPHGQFTKTLHVKRAHSASWQRVPPSSAGSYALLETIQRLPTTYSVP